MGSLLLPRKITIHSMNVLRRLPKAAFTRAAFQVQQKASFARVTGGKGRKGVKATSDSELAVPPPAVVSVEEAWTPVTDKASGLIYYWNTQTNETTALGAPHPASLANAQAQQPGMMSGLGSVMAQGFAFGTGSAIAHSVVGSFFGGGGGSDNHDENGDSGDGYDV